MLPVLLRMVQRMRAARVARRAVHAAAAHVPEPESPEQVGRLE